MKVDRNKESYRELNGAPTWYATWSDRTQGHCANLNQYKETLLDSFVQVFDSHLFFTVELM